MSDAFRSSNDNTLKESLHQNTGKGKNNTTAYRDFVANVPKPAGVTEYGKLKKSLNTESNPVLGNFKNTQLMNKPSVHALYKHKSPVQNGQFFNLLDPRKTHTPPPTS